jgi:cyclic pyranopterin phosphate synthase
VRRDLVPFLARVRRIPGVEAIGITTNGLLLEEHAQGLRDAGVERLNVSIDSFDRETFRRITYRDALPRVLAGLAAAEAAAFPVVKLNCVLMRGINDHEIPAFLDVTRTRAWNVRFIEFMPGGDWSEARERVVPSDEVIARMEDQGFRPDAGPAGSGPARYWRFPGAPGTAGIISPVSNRFCEACNRIRLNARGELRACLLDEGMVDLKSALLAEGDAELKALFMKVIDEKPEKHHDLRSFHMSTIGG